MPLFHIDNSSSPIDRVAAGLGIRQYWKLEELLPENEGLFQKLLKSKHCTVFCTCGFFDMAHLRKFRVWRPSEWFEVEVIDIYRNTEFDVRIGIVRKSGKEIVSKAEVLSPEKPTAVVRLIHRSELCKIMDSYKELELFVLIDGKNEETEDKKTYYMKKFRTDYKELLLSGRNSDFTIHVKHVKFAVHRSFLGARSPVFSAMMEHDMEEKRGGEVTIIDADPDVFRQFLLFLYTGEEEHLDWKNVLELYKLGDKYCVEDLRYLCVERMKADISIENFCEVFYYSQQICDSELSKIVIQFFLEDSKEIVGSEKYNEFMKEHPEETDILSKVLEANK